MSTPRSSRHHEVLDPPSSSFSPTSSHRASYYDQADGTAYTTPNPTTASFSPVTLSTTDPTKAAKRRSTILVHQKSPLLLATPPQITRALAYSHPFLLPLNKLAGLVSWTTGDGWDSCLLLVGFWACVLYGDVVVRLAGPVVLVVALILGMYGRRFSPLSSSGWAEPSMTTKDAVNGAVSALGKIAKGKAVNAAEDVAGGKTPASNGGKAKDSRGHSRNASAVFAENTNTRHQKTLDEMVDTLKEFTSRCNILLEPLLELTDFLSTQTTPTSATTRPALTTLFVRILFCTPVWWALTLPPLRIVTTRRVILLFGTVVLTWHAKIMRVTRTLLWRSASTRQLAALITGLTFEGPMRPTTPEDTPPAAAEDDAKTKTPNSKKTSKAYESELTKALRRSRTLQVTGEKDPGVRFTFIIYENQRRWMGLGWTTSLFAYERGAWTDEHNNLVPPRDRFELPDVEDDSRMQWQWVEGSRWHVDGVSDDAVMRSNEESSEVTLDFDSEAGKNGWIYYDNKWQNGRRGQDGWGRWTRRRKWYRDAELVEVDDKDEDETANADTTDEKTPPPLPARPTTPLPGSSAATQRAQTGAPPSPVVSHAGTSTSGASAASHGQGPNRPAAAAGAERNEQDEERMLSREKEDEYDAASLLSTSSRSGRFKPPSLRRRATGDRDRDRNRRSRRASMASRSEDEVGGGLGTALELEIQGHGKEGGAWGIGDEAGMSMG